MNRLRIGTLIALFAALSRDTSFLLAGEPQPVAFSSKYQGWKTLCLLNGLVELQVLPDVGGRILQYKVGSKEFLWVNSQLAGAFPASSGLTADAGWFNVGGDKIWPAPQGWETVEEWPGPPDPVLDGQPYKLEKLSSRRGEVAIRLTSGKDQRSGIQFSRVVRLFGNSTRVRFEATMKNVDTRPRRWGIWAHTQLDAAKADDSGYNPLLQAWCPLNPKSQFRKGYTVLFGMPDNPSFQCDVQRGLMRAQYQYKVGKIGLDSHAGWVATVDGESGAAFVQRFVFEPDKEYPDGSSVEFWHNGVGQIHAYNRDIVMSTNAAENPYVFESEVLSPLARLKPGQSYTWTYDWYAANIGGDFPVLDSSTAGVIAEPLTAEWTSGRLRLKGRFGVFAPGKVRAEFANAQGRRLKTIEVSSAVSPLYALVLDTAVTAPTYSASVELQLVGPDGKVVGKLANAVIPVTEAPPCWPVEKAWAWYGRQPWLVGCNFLPSTAVNDVEMWQNESFDEETIERELRWARDLGFNTVRVFLNFVVWEADANGLKQRFNRFLTIADRLGIRTMPVLLDDCNFAGRVTAAGKQPDPVPGVHNSQWVSSPPLQMVDDKSAWPRIERYVKGMVGAFAEDRRVVVWDLYNEPGNGMGEKSRPLMEAAFSWAREMNPAQPLTVGAWTDFESPFQRRMMELSDVVTFHGYDGLAGVEAKLKICRNYSRPVLCTEWMARGMGSRFETVLPFFKENKVGCYNWGLVAGRTQTYFPWGSPKGAPEPKLWHHDIFRPDGTPFNPREVQFIKVTTGRLPASAVPQRKTLVPTGEKTAVPWRFTLETPADTWFKPGFDDSAWKQGQAPFGTEEAPIARKPNTVWTNADIWLRREFEMPSGNFSDLFLLMHHDEDAEVYINGVLALRASAYNAAYESFDISPESQAVLKPGRNLMAIHCRQTGGGQYIDAGLEAAASKLHRSIRKAP